MSIVTQGSIAQLEIDVDDHLYYGSKLELKIKNTLVVEPAWFNNTEAKIWFIKPPCSVMQEDLLAVPANEITLKATQASPVNWVSIQAAVNHASKAFKLEEVKVCGAIDFSLIKMDESQLELDKSLNRLVLSTTKDTEPGTSTVNFIEFFFKQHPERTWKVPVKIEIEECAPNQIFFQQTSSTLNYKVGEG